MSKRQAGKSVDEEVVAKRPARAAVPNQQSLAGFDKKVHASTQAKPKGKPKPKGRSKGPVRHGTPCPIAEPIDQPLFNPSEGVLRSSLQAFDTPVSAPKAYKSRFLFDPTTEQMAYPQHVSIQPE